MWFLRSHKPLGQALHLGGLNTLLITLGFMAHDFPKKTTLLCTPGPQGQAGAAGRVLSLAQGAGVEPFLTPPVLSLPCFKQRHSVSILLIDLLWGSVRECLEVINKAPQENRIMWI